ncbi:MAG: hypothetical protein RR411_06920 [Chryseobacterium sp.]
MRTEDNAAEQKRKLDEMNYNPGEDIFNKEEHISMATQLLTQAM